MKPIIFASLLSALLLSSSTSVYGETEGRRSAEQEILVLRQQVDLLSKRLAALEAQNNSSNLSRHGLKQPSTAESQTLPHPKPISSGHELAHDEAAVKHLKQPPVVGDSGKLSLKIGGHINRGVLYATNGNESRTMHVDNDNSASRLRIEGVAKITPELKAIATVEAGINSNSSSSLDISNANALNTSNNVFVGRRIEVAFQHDHMGKLWIGRGPMASDDTAESDLSGTYVTTSGASGEFFAGGIFFRDNANNPVRRIIDVYTGMDGLSRQDRIRYDTPEFNGFSLGFSHANRDSHDAVIKYAGTLNNVKLEAAVAYAKPFPSAPHKQQYNGSISILFPSGFNISFSSGVRKIKDGNRKDPVSIYTKFGYQFNLFSSGLTCLAFDIGQTRSLATNSGVASLYGLHIVQNIDIAATELYLALRKYTYKEAQSIPAPVSSMKDIHAIMAGARIKL